ncbi:MAG: hypothetical protein WB780_01530 [Candidatus Acidiferrales bacterium]
MVNPALNGIPVEPPEHFLKTWVKIKQVQKVFCGGAESGLFTGLAKIPIGWTKLNISPFLPVKGGLQITEQKVQLLGRVAKRFAVI